MLNAVYKIEWTEHERHWGSRPDGVSYHKDKPIAEAYVKAYWASQPSGDAPDEYSSPGSIRLVEVPLDVYNKVQEMGSVRTY